MIIKANTKTITANGKEYKISLNFGVIRRIQSEHKNLTMVDLFEGLEKQDFNIISTLLFNGIKWNHKEDFLTYEEIDNLNLSEATKILETLAEVISASMPEADGEETEEKK